MHGIIYEKVRVLPDGRMSRADAAKFLGIAAGTLANWQSKGWGPRSITVGGRSFYYLRDVENFIQSEISTAQRGDE